MCRRLPRLTGSPLGFKGRTSHVRFPYRVPQAKGYVIKEEQRSTAVAFKGLVYADFETKAVMRIEPECVDLPAETLYWSLVLTLNYKLTRVAEQEFVMPSDLVMKSQKTTGSTEADADYKDYRRFNADANIRFEGADAVH